MDPTAVIEFDLIGRMVWFWPNSNSIPVLARITGVQTKKGTIPAVDMQYPGGSRLVGIPHESSVETSDDPFWSATRKETGIPGEHLPDLSVYSASVEAPAEREARRQRWYEAHGYFPEDPLCSHCACKRRGNRCCYCEAGGKLSAESTSRCLSLL